ncbi:hypothetical protein I5677_05720 [Mobilitalea sibirica]|uniref:Uncharacterized protein n=1 Tax=Mobilitalea sibirica TaxID=1462919 RepID=A0A8J7H1M7_9FIRM|nr:hypothetical protein [Mobilitalea sibirica]MBH1940394.1 hypothetical protein [Mobilitalea sibirica]
MKLINIKQYREEHLNKNKRNSIKKIFYLMLLLCMIISGYSITKASSVTYSGSQVSVRIDYLEELAYINSGSQNSSKIYLSTDNMKSWELVEPFGYLDLSTLLKRKEVIIYLKGNKDTNPLKVSLQGEDSGFSAEYEVSGGKGRVVLNRPINLVEYRKSKNSHWRPVTSDMITSTSIYEMQGASFEFRTIATQDKRAGKIVTVKIPKKPSAPSVKLDGSKLCFTGLRSQQTLYRVGDSTTWIPFNPSDSKDKILDLRSLLAPNYPFNVAIPGGVIEFQTIGSNKKVASYVKTIEVPTQPTVPDRINLNGTTLTISDPDIKRAYEYTIVDLTKTIDLKTARWSKVTASKPVIIKKASIGDKILVRLKSTTDPNTKQVIPASTFKEFVVTSLSH